jgi:hypothetical protein
VPTHQAQPLPRKRAIVSLSRHFVVTAYRCMRLPTRAWCAERSPGANSSREGAHGGNMRDWWQAGGLASAVKEQAQMCARAMTMTTLRTLSCRTNR